MVTANNAVTKDKRSNHAARCHTNAVSIDSVLRAVPRVGGLTRVRVIPLVSISSGRVGRQC